ncbi:MAG TPA: hypothetical protein VKV79_03765 [Terriglobia bacterium]|nr:hypothetical protein [Terriglobia bacterium]
MHLKHILSLAAGVVFVAGFVPYIRAIVRKEAQPSKATWMIWTILNIVTFSGMLAKHTLNSQMTAALLCAAAVAVLAVKYGKPGWTRLDKLCLGGAVLGVALWEFFHDPVLGIVTSLIVLFLGGIPTFVSAWRDPGKEDRTAWTLLWISCVFTVIAIPAFTLADAAQPLTFLMIENIMVFILYTRPRALARSART